MRHALCLALALLPAAAMAHPGHLAGQMGHDHWVAGAAIGAAVAIGIWGAIKGRRARRAEKAAEASAEAAAETQEA